MCVKRSLRGELRRRGCRCLISATILLVLIVADADSLSTRVRTRFGVVQGIWSRSTRGRLVAHYLGIPYAEPPTGDLRFRSTQPWRRTWNDTYYAIKDGTKCTQLANNGNVVGSEDCLYLNIFVPMVSENGNENLKLPVMLYIHGGKFSNGEAHSHVYSPEYLMDQNVIVVTIHYRLNILGFFSTGNKVSSGNYGLKDVLLALRWVNENIERFGGDPNSVTLWGHSAGAAIVHAMTLTNKTEGLFNKCIIQSSCLFHPGLLHSKRVIRRSSLEVASILGCLPGRTRNETEPMTPYFNESSTMTPEEVTERENQRVEEDDYSEEEEEDEDEDEDEEIINCMRSLDAEKLVKATKHFEIWLGNPCSTFGPSIEADSDEAILSGRPLTLMKNHQSRDIPCIVGVTEKDGLVKTNEIMEDRKAQDELRNNLEDKLQYLIEYQDVIANRSAFISAVEDLYFDGNITENLMRNITDLISDAFVMWPEYEMLRHMIEIEKSNRYFYKFGYEGTFSYSLQYVSGRYGPAHGDDLNYLFPILNKRYKDRKLHNTEDDITIINIMTEMWANFAATGVPKAWNVPAWPTFGNSTEYLQIGVGKKPVITAESNFLPERMAFWDEVLSKLIVYDDGPESIVKAPSEEKKSNVSASSKCYSLLVSFAIVFIICLL